VHLRGRYTAPDGTTSVVVSAETAEGRSKVSAVAVVVSNGVPVPEPPPKGPRYVKLAEQDPDVADVLRALGNRIRWIGMTYTRPGRSWSMQSEGHHK
jgi:hypothetical protein